MFDKIIIKENFLGDWLNEYKNWFFFKRLIRKIFSNFNLKKSENNYRNRN